MRLLRRNETGEFTLTKDFVGDDPIPPYAILSHTWEEDQEVIFTELMNGTAKDKNGYNKIRFCGEQAGRDGLQHFWVDTCCINKLDPVELQDAINSMFRWYQNAAKCYVYLSDVSATEQKRSDQCSQRPWEPAFRASRWFTRGWTLQELLAPHSVEFFSSQDGELLGDKKSLEQEIHEITGIAVAALRGAPLHQFGVEERLLWAKKRNTTRQEDKVYSLLGVFGIYMPLLYGEQEGNAFERLREEINKRSKNDECIQHLRITDPRDDKKRIEETKGGLLQDSYHWILKNPDFQQWRNDLHSPLLWIKGDPGKGKTMLLCGIINELKMSMTETELLSYFFCQATDSRINTATAVLRGLVYLLVDQQPSLISHIRKKYDDAHKSLFEDANAWVALSEIFTNILQDPSLNTTYLIIDALDECETGLAELLRLVVQNQNALTTPRVKWIVSSRNKFDIEQQLKLDNRQIKLSLELNIDQISHAVDTYINYKVSRLPSIKDDSELQEKVRDQMYEKANKTFLWAALVFQELENVDSWEVLEVLKEMPASLQQLYDRMMRQILQLKRDKPKFCRLVLSTTTLAFRPLHLLELGILSGLPGGISNNVDNITKIVSDCGSFLTIRGDYIYFVHQSAKDYLNSKASDVIFQIFPSGRGSLQYDLVSRSIQAMSKTLRQDMYNLNLPGISIKSVQVPSHDPLAALRYSCVYWVSHLNMEHQSNLTDDGIIYQFLQNYFLYWLEAICLLQETSMGVLAIILLESCITADKCPKLYAFVQDAKRFILYNRLVIEQAPLQLYYSALVFAPEMSIVRRQFEQCASHWIEKKSKRQENWSAMLQTLEGHWNSVSSVAFSPDGKVAASGSYDKTVQLWDAVTGTALQTLEGHLGSVYSVAFSPDDKVVASGSYDKTVRLWDAVTGTALQILKGHSGSVYSVAFSPDGKVVASGSYDKTVRLWDVVTGTALQTLEGHPGSVSSVAFSPDGKVVASGSGDTVRLWDVVTGTALQTLEGHSGSVNSVAFSPDGKVVASGSGDTVRLWDTGTGTELQTLEGHSNWVSSVAFSPDGKVVASGSGDKTVWLWDTVTGTALQTLEGHLGSVYSVAFSLDGKVVASGSGDKTVWLWDAGTGTALQTLQTLEGHSGSVYSVAFSLDGKVVASSSYDKTVRLWDAVTGTALQTLEGHSGSVYCVTFSPDGKVVASGSYDKTVRLWDVVTGTALQTLEGHSGSVYSVAFSPDGKVVASGSYDKTVRLWDTVTRTSLQTLVTPLQTLKGHSGSVYSIAFSPDGKVVASGSYDKTVRLWDAVTGTALQTLEGHLNWVSSIAFSLDGKVVASGSGDKTVRLWDAVTGTVLQTLEGHSNCVSSVAFSPDGKVVASGSGDKTVRLWDAVTGTALQTLEGHSDSIYSVSFWDDTTGVASHCTFSPQAMLVGVKGDWVTLNGQETLWLPPDYRPGHVAVYNSIVAIGCPLGRVFFLQFHSSREEN